MLILPPSYQPKVLLPVSKQEWRAPSAAQPKDQFGNENLHLVRIVARLHDGHPVWCGWFEDRDDADAFLAALVTAQLGGPRVPRAIWDLPQCFRWPGFPDWFAMHQISGPWSPDIGEHVLYFVDQVDTLSSPTGSLQSYARPATWNDSANNVQAIGGGGSAGAQAGSSGRHCAGAGAGEWRKGTNLVLASSTSYQIAAVALGVANGNDGLDGNPTWFAGATVGAAALAALQGLKGTKGTTTVETGGTGGTGGTGALHNNGGRGGSITATGVYNAAAGGGAAGGPAGAGNNGTDTAVAANTAGGAGDGLNSGGGGNGSGSNPGLPGGNYGGGGGGLANSGTSGGGAQGVLIVTWTPGLGFPWRTSTFNHLIMR